MDVDALFRGAALGFAIAAAVGPIALLTIRRTLAAGAAIGIASGLGVATADALYGGIAAFGLTAVSDLLTGQARILGLVGGAALLGIGVRTARVVPVVRDERADAGRRDLAAAYASMIGLTLTNPLTIVAFAALFAGFGGATGLTGAASLTLGVTLGSAAWWVILVAGVSLLRSRVTPHRLRMVNLVSGTAIAAFGLIAVIAALR